MNSSRWNCLPSNLRVQVVFVAFRCLLAVQVESTTSHLRPLDFDTLKHLDASKWLFQVWGGIPILRGCHGMCTFHIMFAASWWYWMVLEYRLYLLSWLLKCTIKVTTLSLWNLWTGSSENRKNWLYLLAQRFFTLKIHHIFGWHWCTFTMCRAHQLDPFTSCVEFLRCLAEFLRPNPGSRSSHFSWEMLIHDTSAHATCAHLEG